MRRLMTTIIVGSLALVMALPASAHHSFVMFDRQKPKTITGTVKEFQWTNPHCWLLVLGTDGSGAPKQWAIELTSPNILMRQGWRPKTLKPGDTIKVNIYPMRDGSPAGSFVRATLADGRVLTQEQGVTASK